MSHSKSPKNATDVGANPIKREDEGNFKVIVAIDFGTHGTGLGYAVINDDEKKENEVYIEQDWCKNVDNKNKTDILLKANGTFKAFGEEALQLYMNQGDSDSDDDDSSGSGSDNDDDDGDQKENRLANKDMLFESFKMALYEKKIDGSDSDIRDKIACQDGRLYSTATVFIAALTFIRQHIFATFRKKKVNVSSIDEVQWILTVPAIWSDRAKHKMDVWAQRAKLINKNIFNHLRIVYEPDCASISCQYEAADQDSKSNDNSAFGIGQRYVLIDAGGGTVDIAWHQVKAEYCMEEIHHPTGGPWGSDYIDDHFDNLLSEIFGEEAIRPFREFAPANYTKIKNNFRKSKMSFYNKASDKYHKVQLTLEFMTEIPKYSMRKFGADAVTNVDEQEAFNKIIDGARPFGLERGHLKMDGDFVHISSRIWRECLFDKVIDPMIKHVQEMIPIVNQTEDKQGNTKNIKYLCIAGGLASSKYFQYRIHEQFGMNSARKLSIRIPRRPILSVIDGALKLGLRPGYIKTRRLKYTYGIAVDRSERNVDLTRLPPGYLEANVYNHPKTHKRTVRNLFSKWVAQNEAIDIEEKIVKQYRRFHKNERNCKLSIYCSSLPDPYVVEGSPLASVTVPFPIKYQGLAFLVEFYFGDTKIKANVLYQDNKSNMQQDKKNDDNKVILELEYETL